MVVWEREREHEWMIIDYKIKGVGGGGPLGGDKMEFSFIKSHIQLSHVGPLSHQPLFLLFFYFIQY